MALAVTLQKVEETPRYCLYDLGTRDAVAGRVKLYKSSGDVEVLHLSDDDVPARPPFYLAQAVPRLRTYCERDQYPDEDAWTA